MYSLPAHLPPAFFEVISSPASYEQTCMNYETLRLCVRLSKNPLLIVAERITANKCIFFVYTYLLWPSTGTVEDLASSLLAIVEVLKCYHAGSNAFATPGTIFADMVGHGRAILVCQLARMYLLQLVLCCHQSWLELPRDFLPYISGTGLIVNCFLAIMQRNSLSFPSATFLRKNNYQVTKWQAKPPWKFPAAQWHATPAPSHSHFFTYRRSRGLCIQFSEEIIRIGLPKFPRKLPRHNEFPRLLQRKQILELFGYLSPDG